jgi:hypothetical protein
MAKHDNEWNAEDNYAVLEARQPILVYEITSYPDHKQFSGALVERELRRKAGIGAADDARYRILRSRTGEASG